MRLMDQTITQCGSCARLNMRPGLCLALIALSERTGWQRHTDRTPWTDVSAYKLHWKVEG